MKSEEIGFLKQRISGRTVNIHAHLLANEWWGVPGADEKARERMFVENEKQVLEIFKNRPLNLPPKKMEEYTQRIKYRSKCRTLDDDAVYYLSEMDEAGLDLMVNLTMDNLPIPGAGGSSYNASFERVLEENAALRAKYPGRFLTFAGVDPRRGKEAVELLERAVKKYGCVGVGEMICTLWSTMPTDKKLVYPLMEKALELGVPWMNDATMPYGFSQPELFKQMAIDFPDLKICLGGAGAGVNPLSGPDGRATPAHHHMLQLAEEHENIWLDLDDWQAKDNEGIRTYLNFMKRALNGPAKHKVMFGSDYPIYTWMYSEKDWIETIFEWMDKDGIEFTDSQLEMFFSKNALSFLGIEPN
jgi:predicted TIM-barrel fold metal-dependent hydrolase